MRGNYVHVTEDGRPKTPHWKVFFKSFRYVWPASGNYTIKLRLILSFLFLILKNLSSFLLPITLKYIIEDLSLKPPNLNYNLLIFYGLVRFGSQFLTSLQNIAFAAVSANTERTAALEIFKHLQNLSLDFHMSRKTGSVIRSVSRGASSYSTVIRVVLFQLLPVFIQVTIVCVYLFTQYEWYFAMITFSIIASYFLYTLLTTEWRNKYRRVMNEKDNEFNQRAVDALLNFETVKYFNAEEHETRRYDQALNEYKAANILSMQTLEILNCGQNFVISGGIVAALWLAADQVGDGAQQMSVGDFVMINQFILQLYQPLGFLGTYYRMIKQSLIDIESMFSLLQEPINITDPEDGKELLLSAGEVEFKNVSFRYQDNVPILKGISFRIGPGERVAIVGSSGAGKSTIARLLYRFYDVNGGSIAIDGQDIRTVTQKSLRRQIGIVPQDCVLFNDTIGYNISYGMFGRYLDGPSPDMLHHAAAMASLDGFIQSQPDKYETKVGERGLKVSGGEKQRIAIARAILKHPSIMVFDEATSSLDSATETEIQEALEEVSKGRSSLTIAHRLSTIVNSDKIIVLKDGVISEEGTHEELLELGGEYATLWERQNRVSELEESLKRVTSEIEEDSVDK